MARRRKKAPAPDSSLADFKALGSEVPAIPLAPACTKSHSTIRVRVEDGCDVCGEHDPAPLYYIWPEGDVKFDALVAHRMYFLCCACDDLAKTGKLPMSIEVEFGGHMADMWDMPMNDGMSGTSYPGAASPTGKPGTLGPAKPPAVPKCGKHHFDPIYGPEGYGILRASSSRGGLEVDLEADYALFFDDAWKGLQTPIVEAWTPGNKPAPPVLEEYDTSDYPGTLFIEWADWGAPPPTVLKYAKWTAEQWAAGKSIQFGCIGGHGRTGTFLALVLLEAGMATGAKEVTDWVHANYCKDAIESLGQKNAIRTAASEE